MYKILINQETISKKRTLNQIEAMLMGLYRTEYRGEWYYYKMHPLLVVCTHCGQVRKVMGKIKSRDNKTKLMCHGCKQTFIIEVERQTLESLYE